MVASIFTYSKQTVKRTVNRYISWLQVTIQARRQRDAAISREIDGLEEYVRARPLGFEFLAGKIEERYLT